MIKTILADYSAKFNENLPKFFPFHEKEENRVIEAMFYSVANGGKRLRPFLVYETAKLFNVEFEQSLNVATSLECLHSYSLIHDDLPAMDNDDLRRGKPTCHKQFDEATAILAGDGLLTYAFELLSKEKYCSKLVRLLGQMAGAFRGMIAGQMLDLISEKKENSEEIIKRIEEMKTGCLIRYACEAGAILGDATEEEKQALIDYARNIGIAFQITDDILDIEGDQELVGKTLNKDKSQGKLTFVELYGLEQAKEIAKELIGKAKENLRIFDNHATNLKLLADYILTRKY